MKDTVIDFEAAITQFMSRTEFIEQVQVTIRRDSSGVFRAEARTIFNNGSEGRTFTDKPLHVLLAKLTAWAEQKDLRDRIRDLVFRSFNLREDQYPFFSLPLVQAKLFNQKFDPFSTLQLMQALTTKNQDWSAFALHEIEYYLSEDPYLIPLRHKKTNEKMWSVIPSDYEVVSKS